jgi:hypothetical protein
MPVARAFSPSVPLVSEWAVVWCVDVTCGDGFLFLPLVHLQAVGHLYVLGGRSRRGRGRYMSASSSSAAAAAAPLSAAYSCTLGHTKRDCTGVFEMFEMFQDFENLTRGWYFKGFKAVAVANRVTIPI